jgi:hypothetical protein
MRISALAQKRKKNTVWNMMYHFLFGIVHLYGVLNKRRGGKNFGGWVNQYMVCTQENNRGKGKENKGWSYSCSKSPLQPFPPHMGFGISMVKGALATALAIGTPRLY